MYHFLLLSVLTIYDLPGCDFPIKATCSTVFVNTIVAILIVPLLVDSEISSAQYIFYGSIAVTFIKAINMPLIVTLTKNYNRKCNRRDRQYCNSKAWDFYKRQSSSKTRVENQEQNGVSHTAECAFLRVQGCTVPPYFHMNCNAPPNLQFTIYSRFGVQN